MSDAARRGLYIFLAAIAVIIGGVAYQHFWLGDDTAPAIGGAFTLVDQNGVTRHDSDFRGKLMLVYFGYTYCPDACPTTLQAISQTLDLLGDKAAKVQPIFISVDPARDTQAQLKSYGENFTPSLLLMTGTPEALQQAEREYHIYVAKVPQTGSDDYLIDHSSIVYLMGRDGRYLGEFPTGMPPKVMAATIERYL